MGKERIPRVRGKMFYTLIALLVAFILLPILMAFSLSLQILRQTETWMQVSLSDALTLQLSYLQSSSPARQRAQRLEYLQNFQELEELAASENPSEEEVFLELEALLESLSRMNHSGSTGQTAFYLYFTKSDYLLGSDLSGTDARSEADSHIFECWALVDTADSSFARTIYGYDDEESYYYTITICYVCEGCYYISTHLYTEEEGPTNLLSQELLESFPDIEIVYYDSYGNSHCATEQSRLSELYDFYCLGEDDSGSFRFQYEGNSYLAFYVYNEDNHTKIALFCRDELQENRMTTAVLLLLAASSTALVCLFLAWYALNRTYRSMDRLVTRVSPGSKGIRDDIGILETALDRADIRLREQDLLFSRLSLLTEAIEELNEPLAMLRYDELLSQILENREGPFQAEDSCFSLIVNAIVLAFYDRKLPGDVEKNCILHHMEQIREVKDAEALRRRLRDALDEFTRLNEQTDYDRLTYEELTTFIKQNYTDSSLSSASLSEAFTMSPSNVTRIFKKYSHGGFLDYLHRVRVAQACRLLHETELTVAEIAERTGYGTTLTMTRAFKNIVNTTPGQYRRVSRMSPESKRSEGDTTE